MRARRARRRRCQGLAGKYRGVRTGFGTRPDTACAQCNSNMRAYCYWHGQYLPTLPFRSHICRHERHTSIYRQPFGVEPSCRLAEEWRSTKPRVRPPSSVKKTWPLRLEQLPAEAETCPRALFASTCQGRRQALVNMTGGIGTGLSGRVVGTPSTPARGPTAAMYTSRHRKDDTPMVCHVSPPIGMRRADRSRFAGEQPVANIRRPTLYYAPALPMVFQRAVYASTTGTAIRLQPQRLQAPSRNYYAAAACKRCSSSSISANLIVGSICAIRPSNAAQPN
jgi:hypothetical protein